MQLIRLKTTQDERLDAFCRLTDHELRNRLEPKLGICIAETEKVVRLGLSCGIEPLSFLVDDHGLERIADALEGIPGDVPVFVLPTEEVSRLTGYNVTRGIHCAFRRPVPPPAGEVLEGSRLVAVLDGITDATNVGAIVRSAAALGVDAVLLSPTCADPLTRRALRVSMGTIFQIPWARLGSSARDWPAEGIDALHRAGMACVAMALEDDSVDLGDPSLARLGRLALLFGTEGEGLSPRTIGLCDATVRIPMSNGVDSLNVAASSAVAFWELGKGRPRRA